MNDIQRFGQLIAQMLDTDNTKRKDAEDSYEQLETPLKITLLFQAYSERSFPEDIRSMSLVLTRRLWDYNFQEAWDVLAQEQQAQYIDGILRATNDEPSLTLQKKLADVISQFATNLIDEDTGAQKCEKVLQFLEHCNASTNHNLKVVAMTIIESVPNVFGSNESNYFAGIKAMFISCLSHPEASVRTAAAKAFSAFVCHHEEDDRILKQLGSCVPLLLKVCEHVANTGEDGEGPLQALVDIVGVMPKSFNTYLNDILSFGLNTARSQEFEEGVRQTALEILTTLCETAPNMVKKRASAHIPAILEICIQAMTELDDDVEDWLAVDDSEEDVEEDNAALGETSLDRICCALGGKFVFQPALVIVKQLLSDADWKKRHAGIFTLSTIGEGCQRVMEPNIVEIVNQIIPYLKDQHPRVRYAACNALGQMSTDFSPTLQKKCHEKVVPALAHTLMDLTCMRVAAHAGAALVNFSEDCPKHIISTYLPDIMSSLEQVLEATFKHLVEKNRKLVLEQVITTIASVADAAQDLFIQYYDRMIGPLKYILQNSSGENFKLLRGKTIECVSLIGLAVGRDKFAADGQEIMNMLADTMPNLAPDDPQTSYMISSWTRICKVLGPLFAPYLPLVMPSIIRALKCNPEVTIVDDSETVQDDPTWTFASMGDDKSVGIRTSGLEEKVTACEMLVCYARELKELFAPYVEQVFPDVIKNLKFLFHEQVRASSAEILPVLIECVKDQGVEAMYRLWTAYSLELQSAMDQEHDLEVLQEQINSFAESVTILGTALNADEVNKMASNLKDQLCKYEERRQERQSKETDEDADPDDEHDNVDEDEESDAGVLARVSDLFHACFKAYGPTFYPLIESLLPGIIAMIEPAREYTDRQWAVCMIDDIIEFAPNVGFIMMELQQCFVQQAHSIQQAFVPQLVQCLKDKFPEVRQATAYGFGVMALHGSLFTDTCVQVLPLLAEMIAAPDARATEEDNESILSNDSRFGTTATENAISAVAKILKHCGGQVDLAQAIPMFLSWLPTWNDPEESRHIYGFVADLLESNNPHILGEGNERLPVILRIMVLAFHNNAFEDDEDSETLKKRLIGILRVITADPKVFSSCLAVAGLDDVEKATLQRILS